MATAVDAATMATSGLPLLLFAALVGVLARVAELLTSAASQVPLCPNHGTRTAPSPRRGLGCIHPVRELPRVQQPRAPTGDGLTEPRHSEDASPAMERKGTRDQGTVASPQRGDTSVPTRETSPAHSRDSPPDSAPLSAAVASEQHVVTPAEWLRDLSWGAGHQPPIIQALVMPDDGCGRCRMTHTSGDGERIDPPPPSSAHPSVTQGSCKEAHSLPGRRVRLHKGSHQLRLAAATLDSCRSRPKHSSSGIQAMKAGSQRANKPSTAGDDQAVGSNHD